VAALSPTDVWAVGYATSPGSRGALVEHWDSTRWRIVPAPREGAVDQRIAPVFRRAIQMFSSGNVASSLVRHWDGRHWSIVS